MCSICDQSYDDAIHVPNVSLRARNVWHNSHLLSKVISTMQNNNTAAELIFALLQDL